MCSCEAHRNPDATCTCRCPTEEHVRPRPPVTARDERREGLIEKYRVERLNDAAGKHDGCRYFVLDPRHDLFARSALAVYAEQCANTYPELAADLRAWLAVLDEPDTITTVEELDALPVGSVVLWRGRVWQRMPRGSVYHEWYCPDGGFHRHENRSDLLPCTVLYRPEVDQ